MVTRRKVHRSCLKFRLLASITTIIIIIITITIIIISSIISIINISSSSFVLCSKKLPIVVVRDVCPSVCPSVSIISFRGNLISSKPIDLKIGLNVR